MKKERRAVYWDKKWGFLSILSIVSNVFSILAFFGIWLNIIALFQTQKEVSILSQKFDKQESEQVLKSYFFYIEQHDFKNAYNLLWEDIKNKQPYSWYVNWLYNFVSFEGLKITSIPQKDGVSQKYFLAEFWFKNKWEIVIDTKRWISMINNGKDWKINYLSVLKNQNWWNKWACSFYHFNEICK